jgi:hypothetical protein
MVREIEYLHANSETRMLAIILYKNHFKSGAVAQEVEIRIIVLQSQTGQEKSENPSQKKHSKH